MSQKTLMYPGLPRFYPEKFDSSTIKLVQECFRKYLYRIILGRVPFKSKYEVIFNFGTAVHKFYEVIEVNYMKGQPPEMCLALGLEEVKKCNLVAGEGKYEFYTRTRLFETCMVVFEDWKKEKASGAIKVLAVEQPINIQLADGTFIGGRADQIVSWNGHLWGRDFKTTSKMEQYFNATLDPNDQATRYIFMESKLHFGAEAIDNGRMVKGIIFQVIQNTKTTTPKIYRILVTKNQYQLKQWEKEQAFFHRLLKTLEEEDIWPMCPTSCSFCDYSKVCKAPSESSQENILRNEYNLSPWDFNSVEQVTLKEQ